MIEAFLAWQSCGKCDNRYRCFSEGKACALKERYPRIYVKLKTAGFSAAKAMEILLSAKRGDPYPMYWVRAVCRLGRTS